jgi:divalent metal cation (Fe/Co/Zn/Cd) transporter
LLFSIGGMFSIYEGIHKISHPEPVSHVSWGIGVLVFSIFLEGYAAFSNVVELNKRRGQTNFFKYLRETKDSDLIVIFGENSAAVLGLVLALTSLVIAYYTGDGRWDGYGSFAIGIVLIAVAIFLAVEVKSLLIGESADPNIKNTAAEIALIHPHIEHLIECITVQQGPGEVLACFKIQCSSHLTAPEVSAMINDFEAQLRAKCPEVKWLFVEPDLFEEGNTTISLQ